MTLAGLAPERLEVLAGQFGGILVGPADATYDELRSIHNGLVDKAPALVACCRGTADVVAAVRFALGEGLELAVRGGGHNVAGRAVSDGGAGRRHVAHARRRGRPGARDGRASRAGALWADVNREAAAHGLAVTGGAVSTTGVARAHARRRARVAHGPARAGGRQPARGGGRARRRARSCASSADARRRPVLGAARRRRQLRRRHVVRCSRCTRSRDRPAGSSPIRSTAAASCCVLRGVTAGARRADRVRRPRARAGRLGHEAGRVVVCHAGDARGGRARARAAARRGARRSAVDVDPMPYPVDEHAARRGVPAGALNYWRSTFVRGVDDGLIDTMVERVRSRARRR